MEETCLQFVGTIEGVISSSLVYRSQHDSFCRCCFGRHYSLARRRQQLRLIGTTKRNVLERAPLRASGADSNSTEKVNPSWWQRAYINVTGFPFPLRPFFQRRTVRTEIVPGQMWSFEQEHGLGGTFVAVNIRMTVIKLSSSGQLFVHAPIAPTRECLELLRELNAPVAYIILPTFAYEHKIFVAPFSRRFPRAKVYSVRGWSWPINLPDAFFGIFRTGEIVSNDKSTPWAAEIEQKVLGPCSLGIAPYTEAVFFHKPSRSLLVTDAVVCVPSSPPSCIDASTVRQSAEDRFFSTQKPGDRAPEEVSSLGKDESWPAPTSALGWARMALLALYFGPHDLLTPQSSFEAVSEKLLVAPVLRKLVYSRMTDAVAEFAQEVALEFDFTQIVPAHFKAPVSATTRDWLDAFAFVLRIKYPDTWDEAARRAALPEEDFETLDFIERTLLKLGLTPNEL